MFTVEDRVIWGAELTQRLGYCTDTIRRQLKAGKLPKPDVHQSRQKTGWKISTLKAAGIDLW